MNHPSRSVLVLAFPALFLAASPASAQMFFDNFESYKLGSLDKNDPAGPNQAPNGSGNPWFGSENPNPNAVVVGPENGVMPYSGQQMIRGQPVPGIDNDQNWYNLAYRLNNGLPFTANISLDWWFYDPLGIEPPMPGDSHFRDCVALAFYDTAPADTDAPDTYDLTVTVIQVQRLCLGAEPSYSNPRYDPNYYQARVLGADDDFGGWFNTSTMRSVGWHHGAIVVGPMLADGTNDVTFFIDDMSTPTLEHNSITNYGYNVIEINTKFGPQTGYFDDINFTVLSGGEAAPPGKRVSIFPGTRNESSRSVSEDPR
jgi:hypothetical protein